MLCINAVQMLLERWICNHRDRGHVGGNVGRLDEFETEKGFTFDVCL
jgi:hypothetical protein